MAFFKQPNYKKPLHANPLGEMTEVTDYLYLGSVLTTRNENSLKENRITHVINGI